MSYLHKIIIKGRRIYRVYRQKVTQIKFAKLLFRKLLFPKHVCVSAKSFANKVCETFVSETFVSETCVCIEALRLSRCLFYTVTILQLFIHNLTLWLGFRLGLEFRDRIRAKVRA